MAHTYRLTRHRTVRRTETEPVEVTTNSDQVATQPSAAVVLARIVEIIGGIVLAILGLRFLLALFGANAANAFAHFIYSVSRPFVSPFFGLFNYQEQLGIGRFEFETLIAIIFWGLVFWGISRLLHVAQRTDEVE